MAGKDEYGAALDAYAAGELDEARRRVERRLAEVPDDADALALRDAILASSQPPPGPAAPPASPPRIAGGLPDATDSVPPPAPEVPLALVILVGADFVLAGLLTLLGLMALVLVPIMGLLILGLAALVASVALALYRRRRWALTLCVLLVATGLPFGLISAESTVARILFGASAGAQLALLATLAPAFPTAGAAPAPLPARRDRLATALALAYVLVSLSGIVAPALDAVEGTPARSLLPGHAEEIAPQGTWRYAYDAGADPHDYVLHVRAENGTVVRACRPLLGYEPNVTDGEVWDFSSGCDRTSPTTPEIRMEQGMRGQTGGTIYVQCLETARSCRVRVDLSVRP